MGHHYVLEDPLHVGAYQLDKLVRGDVARAVMGESQPNKTQEEAFDKAIKEQLPSLRKLLSASETCRHQRVNKILEEKCPTGVTPKEGMEFAEEKKNKLERARTDDLELEKSLEQLVNALEHYQKDKSPESREDLMKAQQDFAHLRGGASGLYAKVGESMAYMEKLQDAVDFVVEVGDETKKKVPSSKAYYPEVKLAAKHVFLLHDTSLPSYYTSGQVSAASDERAMDHRSELKGLAQVMTDAQRTMKSSWLGRKLPTWPTSKASPQRPVSKVASSALKPFAVRKWEPEKGKFKKDVITPLMGQTLFAGSQLDQRRMDELLSEDLVKISGFSKR